tara:strand:+ start:3405 stop:4142 length:738 start_codon:yes stop_codon:yes gene_type:complete
MDIESKNILITGASGSFGSYLTNYFSKKCLKVIAVDKDFKNFSIKNQNIIKINCDLTDSIQVDKIISKVYKNHKISILLNLAGYIHNETLINLINKNKPTHSFENWRKTIDLNMTTCFNTTKTLVSLMIKDRNDGLIINFSSISSQGNIGQTAYSASKAGIEAMTKVWAKEFGVFNIRSVCISPGFINTDSTRKNLTENIIKKYNKEIPIGRFGTLDEISKCISMIIENDFINGKVIKIDGGMTI